MHIDPITEEIRAIRQSLAAQFDNDLVRIVADLRQRESTSGRTFVQLPKRPVREIELVNHNVTHDAAEK